jgi:quercetin dioxygenase-like cupin family protein
VRRLRLDDLPTGGPGSVLDRALPDHEADHGGVAVVAPGERSHPEGRHVHETPEAFLILSGQGTVEIDGAVTGIEAGDVLLIEPGEDHHLIGAPDRGLVTVWLHTAPRG